MLVGFWEPMINKISGRLDVWKKTVSLGGGQLLLDLVYLISQHISSYLFKITPLVALQIEKL